MRAKKLGGSVTGFKAPGGAAFFVLALVEIRPKYRLPLFLNVTLVFEMDDVEDVLLLERRQEPEHGDEIGLEVRERASITDEPLLSLDLVEAAKLVLHLARFFGC